MRFLSGYRGRLLSVPLEDQFICCPHPHPPTMTNKFRTYGEKLLWSLATATQMLNASRKHLHR